MMYQWRWFRTARRRPRGCGVIRAATLAGAAFRATFREASLGLVCLSIIVTPTLSLAAADKNEVPRGYGNAPTAAKPPAAKAAGAAKKKPATPRDEPPAGDEEAAAAQEKPAAAKAVPAAKAAAEREEEAPPGYEDAATADKPPGAARRVVPAPAAGGPVDPSVLQLAKQYLPRFRQQILKPELAFVRRACQPDDDQLRDVAAAAEERLAGVVRKYAVAQNRMRHGGIRASSPRPEPRKLVQQDVAAVVEARLRPDQVERYRRECELRAARRKRAVVLNLVAWLDQELLLSAEQRDKLVELLTQNYQESWGPWLGLLTRRINALPAISHELVDPVLNERQKDLWRAIPKSGNMFFGSVNFVPAGTIIEDPELEEVLSGP